MCNPYVRPSATPPFLDDRSGPSRVFDGIPDPAPPDTQRLPPRSLTLEQVALLLGVSTRTVRRLIAAGRLRKRPLERAVRISPDDLEAFLSIGETRTLGAGHGE